MKNVILTAAIGYNYSQINNFIKSIKFPCDLVLFCDRDYKINNHFVGDIKLINVKKNPIIIKWDLNTPNNIRLLWYKKYLEENIDYNKILLTDIRDVVFQSSPFDLVNDSRLVVAKEDVLLKNEKWNKMWIESLYGKKYMEEHGDSSVYCSGTIIGTYKALTNYLDFYELEIENYGLKLDTGDFKLIIDQGIFNKYVYEHEEDCMIQSNSNGKIITCGYASNLRLNYNSELLNEDGVIYSIVHQYDRKNLLVYYYDNLYDNKKEITEKLRSIKNKVKYKLKQIFY
jgi:hypothetical protein